MRNSPLQIRVYSTTPHEPVNTSCWNGAAAQAAITGQPRITKEQAQASISGLKGMTPEQLAAHARGQFTPGQAASPADLERAAEMLEVTATRISLACLVY